MSPINIVSLGAGVQSSTMALMAEHGEIKPKPDCAIFADTKCEPKSVYDWLTWLTPKLSFPVHIVTAGNLGTDALRIRKRRDGQGYWTPSGIPAYTINNDGSNGIMPRQCTHDFKIIPIRREQRRLAGITGRRIQDVRVISWIGISADEAHRMKASTEAWLEHRWPLIDKGITRQQCLEWMRAEGYPRPPRSACVFCPYHSDDEWIRLRDEEPLEFQRAIDFERDFRAAKKQTVCLRAQDCFLHSSRVPLNEVNFVPSRDPKQKQLDLGFGNECEGLCGV